jgi:hypothetical protein
LISHGHGIIINDGICRYNQLRIGMNVSFFQLFDVVEMPIIHKKVLDNYTQILTLIGVTKIK